MRRTTTIALAAATAASISTATATRKRIRRIYGGSNCRVSNHFQIILSLLIVFSFTNYNIDLVYAQEATTTTTETTLGSSYTDSQLEEMSNSELERICLERGFEIVDVEDSTSTSTSNNDNNNNTSTSSTSGGSSSLTHDDYLDAARRCLGIEKELNELLDQYPDIAKEFEEEFELIQKQQDELLQEQIQTTTQEQQTEEKKLTSTTTDHGSSSSSSMTDNIGSLKEQQQEGEENDHNEETADAINLSIRSIMKEVIATFKNDMKKIIDIIYVVLKPVIQPIVNTISKVTKLIKSQQEKQQQQRQQKDSNTPSQEGET